MANWSNDLEIVFIQNYQREPILWNPKHPSHRNKQKYNDAWARISEKMDISINDLKKKKDSLMATFRGHLRKLKSSQRSGNERDEIYKPIWFAFELMYSFLGETVESKKTNDSMFDNEIQDGQEEGRENTKEIQTNDKNRIPLQFKRMMRRRKNAMEIHKAEKYMKEAFGTLKTVIDKTCLREEDECDLYGKMLAKKLRKLPEDKRVHFMYEIDGMFIRRISNRSPSCVSSYVSSALTSPNRHRNRSRSVDTVYSDSASRQIIDDKNHISTSYCVPVLNFSNDSNDITLKDEQNDNFKPIVLIPKLSPSERNHVI